jgi:hypothetical protein
MSGALGLVVLLKRGHPVARALLGIRHDLYHQVADVLESGPCGLVEAVEIVIYGWHGRNDTRRGVGNAGTGQSLCGHRCSQRNGQLLRLGRELGA